MGSIANLGQIGASDDLRLLGRQACNYVQIECSQASIYGHRRGEKGDLGQKPQMIGLKIGRKQKTIQQSGY